MKLVAFYSGFPLESAGFCWNFFICNFMSIEQRSPPIDFLSFWIADHQRPLIRLSYTFEANIFPSDAHFYPHSECLPHQLLAIRALVLIQSRPAMLIYGSGDWFIDLIKRPQILETSSVRLRHSSKPITLIAGRHFSLQFSWVSFFLWFFLVIFASSRSL